ncbi:MAG: dual specificity protein phosphatase family protein [Planctomycetaceae bacterium]
MKQTGYYFAGRRVLARSLFVPTYLWNRLNSDVLKRRNWWDRVDENVIVGALPHARDVPRWGDGVTGVVNTCEEYGGPTQAYAAADIEQFRMPTIDFTHPHIDDVENAVSFIRKHADGGGTVYVHCKAGRARSATVALCWLIDARGMKAAEAQATLLPHRSHVHSTLPARPVVQEFERRRRRK